MQKNMEFGRCGRYQYSRNSIDQQGMVYIVLSAATSDQDTSSIDALSALDLLPLDLNLEQCCEAEAWRFRPIIGFPIL